MQLKGLHIVRLLFILVFLCRITTASFAQYTGGNNDGNGTDTAQTQILGTIISDDLYNGGSGDGSSGQAVTNKTLGSADSLYNGGGNDGSGTDTAQTQFLGAVIANGLYNGGSGDGSNGQTQIKKALGSADSLYNGGSNDGNGTDTAQAQFLGNIIGDGLYSGGAGDGHGLVLKTLALIGSADTVYSGGAGNGVSYSTVFIQALGISDDLYNGGNGKGDILYTAVSANLNICGSDTVVWNGSVSNFWAQAANWDCGVVPGVNSHVIIPSGRPRYPVINVFREVRSIRLQPGSSLLINTGGYLKLNGQ